MDVERLPLLQFDVHVDVEIRVDFYCCHHGLKKVPVTLLVLAIFKVDASDVIEGRAQFFFVIHLSEDLGDLVVIQKSLVVISNMH